MRLLMTDSGLGGLSVCAHLEQLLTGAELGRGVEILYVNATPEDRFGYNSLDTQAERIQLFDRFLDRTYQRFSVDEIAVACNTLSVLLGETEFVKNHDLPICGIVEAGVEICTTHLQSNNLSQLAIFATETTVEANTYPLLMNMQNVELISQPCPELAHAISNDAEGEAARKLLERYIPQALDQFSELPEELAVLLACTHYGYQTAVFAELFEYHGIKVDILNPNKSMADNLFAGIAAQTEEESNSPLEIKFYSRYEIPSTEIESMEAYLAAEAPQTLSALTSQIVIPELF